MNRATNSLIMPKTVKSINFISGIFFKKKEFKIYGFIIIKTKKIELNKKNLKFCIGNNEVNNSVFIFKLFFGIKIIFYSIRESYAKFIAGDIQNKIYLVFRDENIKRSLKWGIKLRNNLTPKFTKIKKISNSALFIRRNTNGNLFLTSREHLKTDTKKEKTKIFFANLIAPLFKIKKTIILFEKECNKYEESAAVLYRKMIDKGHKNTYFILSNELINDSSIPTIYKKNMIRKHSFKHYIYFFASKKFISTETMEHAVELRCANKYVAKKVYTKKYQHIFLQHGVMNMIAPNSKYRKQFFNNKSTGMRKIVVSSRLEANNIIKFAGYKDKDIYITGLPKFDFSIKKDNAKKILIMLTWRPWEYNLWRSDFSKTSLYKSILEIYESIPEKFKSNTEIMLHPLLKNAEIISCLPISKEDNYDRLLSEGTILITDYSSIAYDAFYRGLNIIFWWKEKDECLKKYDSNLLLNEKNIFGDVCYDSEKIGDIIEKNYNKPRKKCYVSNFKKVVEFDDNNNTERLIKELKKDMII